jgi:phospholipid/cholesterol/gamma-HCH transport system substrate-binding protein
VLLTLNIDAGRVLRTSESPRIATASLLGDAVIEFVPKDADEVPPEIEVIQNGETIITTQSGPTGPSDVFQVVVDLQDKIEAAFESVELAGDKIAKLTESFASIVGKNDDQMKSLVAKSNLALEQFGKAMGNVNDVIGDEHLKVRIKEALVRLPVVVEEARLTLTDARKTLAEFARVGQRAERNLENLEGLTRPLGEQGDELVATIQRSIGRVEEIMAQLVQFTQALNNPDGSLGRLVHDPLLFERINMAASNIEQVTRKLKPIMNDARILTDKLARDPGQLGLRGALSRQPKGEGLKYPLIAKPPTPQPR